MTATLPRVLIVTDSCPDRGQGTGAALIKHLAEYPRDRLHSAFVDPGQPSPDTWAGTHFPLEESRSSLPRVVRFVARDLLVNMRLAVVGRRWRESAKSLIAGYRPDVIYTIPYTERGLYLTRLLASLMPDVPVVLHLFDWMPRMSRRIANKLLGDVAAVSKRRWTLGDNLTAHATRVTGTTFATVPICYATLASRPACGAWAAESPFRACIIGNIWSRSAFHRMCDAWELLQSKYANVGPIEWAASDWTLAHGWGQLLKDQRFSRIIRPAGFLTGDDLTTFLQNCHVSFVPFATEEDEHTTYALYSVPSRFAELACCGVPVVAITPPDTGFGRFLQSNAIREILGSPACSTATIAHTLEARFRDPGMSTTISRSLYAYAIARCDIARYRDFLYGQLADVAFGQQREGATTTP